MSHLLLLAVLEDISRLLSNDVHVDVIIEEAKGLLSDEQTSKRRKILSDLLLNLEDRSELETRDEDADWFQGRTSGRLRSSSLVQGLIWKDFVFQPKD